MSLLISVLLCGQLCGPSGCILSPPSRVVVARYSSGSRWTLRDISVRIVNRHPGSAEYGSGTIFGPDGADALVITAGHIFEHGAGDVTVINQRGNWAAKLVALDSKADLAALVIQAGPGMQTLRLAATAPETAEAVGLGTGLAHMHQGDFLFRDVGPLRQHGYSFMAHPGDSGGGVYNTSLDYAGIVSTVAANETDRFSGVVPVTRIREFLAKPACLRFSMRMGLDVGGQSPISPPSSAFQYTAPFFAAREPYTLLAAPAPPRIAIANDNNLASRVTALEIGLNELKSYLGPRVRVEYAPPAPNKMSVPPPAPPVKASPQSPPLPSPQQP